jgi:hypothetical protein
LIFVGIVFVGEQREMTLGTNCLFVAASAPAAWVCSGAGVEVKEEVK